MIFMRHIIDYLMELLRKHLKQYIIIHLKQLIKCLMEYFIEYFIVETKLLYIKWIELHGTETTRLHLITITMELKSRTVEYNGIYIYKIK